MIMVMMIIIIIIIIIVLCNNVAIKVFLPLVIFPGNGQIKPILRKYWTRVTQQNDYMIHFLYRIKHREIISKSIEKKY